MKVLLAPIFVLLFSLLSHPVSAQEIPSLSFEELETWMAEHDDGTYVYNFWATWCKPCIVEMPHFEELSKNYAGQGLKVVFVSLDFPEQVKSALIPFIKAKGIQSQVIHLDDQRYSLWIDKISPDWSGAIPATLILNEDKGVRAFKEEVFTYESLCSWVEEVIQ